MIVAMKYRTRAVARSQSGYAMLMVMFLATVLLLGAIAAAPYVRTERQREKEQEMIWRGKQYVRGVKLYYRKTGRFPTSVDDLTKPKLGSLRFMRQAYKEQGGWRLEIYLRWTFRPACRQLEASADRPDARRKWRATRYSSRRQSSA